MIGRMTMATRLLSRSSDEARVSNAHANTCHAELSQPKDTERNLMKRFAAISAVTLAITGCGSTNNFLAEKQKVVEYYRIFDIKTSASRQAIAKAASNGIGRNVNNTQEATPIPSSSEIPDVPGRFKLVNPLQGSSFAMLAGGAGSIGFRVATCENAVWTAKAERDVPGSNNLRLDACLFQYKDGYHLDLYAVFTKQEGGLMQLSRVMANSVVGTPEEWTEKVFADIVRTIKSDIGGEIIYLEGQPEPSDTPWLDTGDPVAQRN